MATPGPRFAPLDVVLLIVLGAVWGSAYIFIREGIVLGASPFPYAAVRYAFSAAGFAIVAASLREKFPNRRALAVSAGIGGIFVIGLYGGFLYWGEQFTTGAYASMLSTTSPILTVVVASVLLPHEKLGARSLVGLAVGFAGVGVLLYPQLQSGPGGWTGPTVIVGAFLSAAVGVVLIRRYGMGRQGLWQIGAQFAVGAVLLGVATVVLPGPEGFPDTAGVWASLAILVLFSSLCGYFIYYLLVHRVGPVRANAVTYLIPLSGIGLGAGLFGEPIGAIEVVGFVIVLVGVAFVILGSGRSTSPGS
ncbi:MAG: DMT family transporter [Candidatus Thermoplasmatota archaeon]|nr:DMT family transporter [Candidatus Thermoplasmatota archaeon]